MIRRLWVAALMVLATAPVLPAFAQTPNAIRIGYAISQSGPNAQGADTTVLPNYHLWVTEVNAAGGIMLRGLGRRVPIEVVEYDDRSNVDDMLTAVERLIKQDKVDFILPPWGTGFNLLVGPLLNRAGYPHLAVTSATDEAPTLAKQWPNSFWFLGTTSGAVEALADTLSMLRKASGINGRVAMVSVADQFGIAMAKSARRIFKRQGFTIAYDRSYSVAPQDMRQIVAEVRAANVDSFVAFSYPPDTFALAEQARAVGFNPKVFYTAVGTAFPAYKKHFGANAEGVMGIGGWNADSPESKDYLRRYREATGQEPDRWASPITYASLQMLQQAIERVGRIDRAAVIKELQTGTFQTIVGPVTLKDNQYTRPWYVGQWQNGEFYGVAPATLPGARPIRFPKPAWQAGG